MKRRTASKPANGAARVRCVDIFPKAPGNTKNLTKKKVAKSAASSILGLKSRQVDTVSEGSTRWSSDEGSAVDHVTECQRLRGQLERVLIDHQRQEEEIVALRALAKSLKDEVEAIQERQQLQRSECSSDMGMTRGSQRTGSHEFFKLDVQVEKLEGENAELRRQLEDSQEEFQRARAYIAEKLPVYKLAAVKANAELRCVKSQLQQERAQSDRLQRQLVKCKARQDDVHVRVSPERGNNQDEHDDDSDIQESEIIRRERAAFFRDCMRVHGNSDNKETCGELDDFGTVAETRKTQSSIKSNSRVEPGKLVNEDLLGLDFYPDGMALSPARSSKSI